MFEGRGVHAASAFATKYVQFNTQPSSQITLKRDKSRAPGLPIHASWLCRAIALTVTSAFGIVPQIHQGETRMFATQKRNLIALSVFFAVATAVAKPVSSAGLVLNFRNGIGAAKLRDSTHFKNSGRPLAVVVPHSASLVSMQDTRQFTLAVWIKPSSIPNEFPVIVSKGAHNSSGTNGGYELTLNANGDNDVVFYSGDFGAYTGAANGSLISTSTSASGFISRSLWMPPLKLFRFM
jgi:hypothetical protein